MIKALINRLGLFPDSPNGAGGKALEKKQGVDFVQFGSQVVEIAGGGLSPNADRLTRSIAYATSAYAFSAIDYRASRVSEPPLRVQVEDEERDEWLPDHELAGVLAEPSLDYDMGELLWLTEAFRLISGSALWVIDRDRLGRPARFTPFSGDDFTSESADGRIYGRFWVRTAEGRKPFPPEDCIYFRDPNPASWRSGTSRLEVALSLLDLGHQVNVMVRNFARRALFPGGVISPDASWNPDEAEFQQYVDRITQYHAGPSMAGEPLVLLGGTSFSQTAAALKDMLPTEILNRIEATVGAVFGVAPVVLGWQVGLENSPWSQMGEARRSVYEETIEPRWRDMEKRLTRALLPPEERERGLFIRFDSSDVRALFDDDKLLAEVAAMMRREWTLDERRAYTGMQPLPEGDPRGGEIEGQGTEDGGMDLAGLLGAGAWGEDGDQGAEGTKSLRGEKALAWAIFDFSCKAAERTWENVVYRGLKEWRDAVVRIAGDTLREVKAITSASGDEFEGEFALWMEQTGLPLMRSLVYPLVFTTAEKATKQAAAKLGLSFSVFEQAILRYAERETAFLVGVMGETTGKAVAGIVQDGLAAGDLIRDLTKRLEDSAQFSRTRAKLVARTETTRAWNGSQRTSLSEYARTSGRGVEKSWLSARDDRVRDEHIDLDDGEFYPIDEMFANGLTEPGEPNCRCTLVYRLTDPLGRAGT